MSGVLVEARGLVKHFPVEKSVFSSKNAVVHAVDGVSLTIREGETLACVGESGCGKSTLGRLLIRLIEPTAGTVSFQGEDITELKAAELRKRKRNMQIIFQDPFGSLSPRMSVEQIIGASRATGGELSFGRGKG